MSVPLPRTEPQFFQPGVRHCVYRAIGFVANHTEATSVNENGLSISEHEVSFYVRVSACKKAKSVAAPYFVCVSSSNRKWLG
jgi:hypothetical protein